jgi:diguanylate cyclase (GGDEF)-like protein/PAS domain S-box-containing protein
MRQGRFAGLGAAGHGADASPPLADLFLFDLRASESEEDERVAAERARSLDVSLLFLAASHALWAGALLFALIRQGASADWTAIGLPLAMILVIDIGLWRLLRSGLSAGLRPHARIRIALAGVLAGVGLWSLVIGGIPQGETSLLVRASLIAGIGAAIPAFFNAPALLVSSCLATLACSALIPGGAPLLLPIGIPLSLFLASLSLFRMRDTLVAARERLTAEWEAKKARRFVADYERSGRGWFWEINADGALTYVSEQLAGLLGVESGSLLGRPLEELLLVQGGDSAAELERTLGFHLNARFPFDDVIVRAPGGEEIWWALSGSPNFDPYGRFLGFRGIGTNLSEQKRHEAEASKLARYDSLTGLPNRAMMRGTLDEALANAAERKRGCALMMIDLDRFKQVNDTLGHPMGDKLLRQVAERLTEVLGEEGQVGRLGGDEFEAILPGTEEEGRLASLAGRLIEEVSRPYSIEGHEIVIGASVGIAIARPGKAYAAALIKDADLALYAAKDGGRGTFRFFAPEMHAEVTERQILEADLKDALSRGQLHLLYQPQVNSVGEEVVAFEALLRWQHPLRGTIPPATIIPLAEESGVIGPIGDWVLRTACAEAAKWPAHLHVAVNLSSVQFADPALAATVTGALAAAGIEPERLELEINEEVFLADSKATEKVLAGLRAIGVRLALDNFGTGRSGLGHLRDAPLDKIKIDRSFVRGAATPGSRNAAIVRAIVVLAESLGMDTTAEGAETLEELALIRRLGCSQVQGFIFGKPMPAAEALKLASESRPPADVAGFSRPPRHRLIRMGRLQWDGKALEVRLRNISPGGAMIECERPIPADTRVALDLAEGGVLGAEVRWSQQGQVGLRFDDEFELRKLARPKPGAAGLKMVTPDYLVPGRRQELARGPSPLAAKRHRTK